MISDDELSKILADTLNQTILTFENIQRSDEVNFDESFTVII